LKALSPDDGITTEDEYSDARSEWKDEVDGGTPLLTPASPSYEFDPAADDDAAVSLAIQIAFILVMFSIAFRRFLKLGLTSWTTGKLQSPCTAYPPLLIFYT
jgi:hypothetical protein